VGNLAASGAGGRGGGGIDGGAGGDSEDSLGGGLYDAFKGTLDLLHGALTGNAVLDGSGGAGGPGPFAGPRGQDSRGYGGGASIDPDATAFATMDTLISGNRADHRPNVDGDLGTL
jgi:hypothetical protein